MALFENFIVAVHSNSLRRALKAIFLALLPGLEEESSEEFERTLNILATLKEAIGRDGHESDHSSVSSEFQYFWQCLFSTSITSTSRRSGVLAYLNRNLPRLDHTSAFMKHSTQANGHGYNNNGNDLVKFAPSIEAVVSPDPGLLIRCFCAGLRDDQLLIQRGFLDLLVTNLPMNSPIFIKEIVVSKDRGMLIVAATSVVARRDMSLNRRLWSWFLGPELTTDSSERQETPLESPGSDPSISPSRKGFESQTQYFERYGLDPLVQGIEGMILTKSVNVTERARPLRICLSLMDRWEIGGLVIPQIFFQAIRSVWQYEKFAPSPESYAEVLRSANVFFDGVESGLIWTELFKAVERAFTLQSIQNHSAEELLNIVLFVTENFNLQEEEMLIVHMPVTSLVLILRIQICAQEIRVSHESDFMERVQLALKITSRLVDLIPARAFRADAPLEGLENLRARQDNGNLEALEILEKTQSFYNHSQGNVDQGGSPFTPEHLGTLLLQGTINLMTTILQSDTKMAFKETLLAILDTLIRKRSSEEIASLSLERLYASLSGNLTETRSRGFLFSIIAAKVATLETLYIAPQVKSKSWVSKHLLTQLVPGLITGIWPALSPSRPIHNVEAVRCLWRLQSICPDKQLIKSTLTSLMVSDQPGNEGPITDIESARRIGTLWAHSLTTATATAQSKRSSRIQVKQDSTDSQLIIPHEVFLLERPLLLLLDVLEDPKSRIFPFIISWLQNLPNLNV